MINYFKYLLFKNKLKKPLYLVYHVTYSCNSRCKMCFLWKDLNKPGKDLDLDQINKLSKSLGKLLWVTLGGGEPFLRDDLDEICKIFYKNNKVETISIPTNCLLPKKIYETTKRILEKTKTRITIGLSLDGIGEDHDNIRGIKGNFKKFLETYEILSPLRKQYPNFSIGVLTTVMDLNFDKIPKMYDYIFDNLNVDWHTVELMRGSPRDPVKTVTIEQYRKLMPKILEMNKKYTFGRGIKSKVVKAVKAENVTTIYEILRKKEQVIPCLAGLVNAVVDPYGNVQLCELLPKVGDLVDVDFNFDKVWFSEKATKQRKFIKNKGCHCTHCIFQNTNILFNVRKYPSLIKKIFCQK